MRRVGLWPLVVVACADGSPVAARSESDPPVDGQVDGEKPPLGAGPTDVSESAGDSSEMPAAGGASAEGDPSGEPDLSSDADISHDGELAPGLGPSEAQDAGMAVPVRPANESIDAGATPEMQAGGPTPGGRECHVSGTVECRQCRTNECAILLQELEARPQCAVSVRCVATFCVCESQRPQCDAFELCNCIASCNQVDSTCLSSWGDYVECVRSCPECNAP